MSSTPLNSTYSWSELQNMTGADNILDIASEINVWLGGILGLFIWVGVLVVTFMISLYTGQNPQRALLASFFMGTVIAVPLYMASMISQMILLISIIMTLIMVFINIASK